MQRVLAALFVSMVLLAGAAVDRLLSGSPGFSVQAATASNGAPSSAERKTSAVPISFVPDAADRPALPVPASASTVARAPREISSQETTYGSKGLWLTDRDRGRIALIDRGPTPRLGAIVPIFMYHHVRPIDFSTTNAFVSDLTLPPAEFEQELQLLKERGFKSASLTQLLLFMQGRAALPANSAVLTFDDGYRDNYDYAFPLLLRYGFSGTFFIVTSLVGKDDYMQWSQIREMASKGMEIGSHTVSHVDLARVAAVTRDRELIDSKRTLQDTLGLAVPVLSYPSGSRSADAVEAARKAGYEIAVTTDYGATIERTKLMELPRVRIHGTDTLATFRWRVEQYFPAGGPATK